MAMYVFMAMTMRIVQPKKTVSLVNLNRLVARVNKSKVRTH